MDWLLPLLTVALCAGARSTDTAATSAATRNARVIGWRRAVASGIGVLLIDPRCGGTRRVRSERDVLGIERLSHWHRRASGNRVSIGGPGDMACSKRRAGPTGRPPGGVAGLDAVGQPLIEGWPCRPCPARAARGARSSGRCAP